MLMRAHLSFQSGDTKSTACHLDDVMVRLSIVASASPLCSMPTFPFHEPLPSIMPFPLAPGGTNSILIIQETTIIILPDNKIPN
jgi:hypothetical protein